MYCSSLIYIVYLIIYNTVWHKQRMCGAMQGNAKSQKLKISTKWWWQRGIEVPAGSKHKEWFANQWCGRQQPKCQVCGVAEPDGGTLKSIGKEWMGNVGRVMNGQCENQKFKNKHQDVYLKHDCRLFMLHLENSQQANREQRWWRRRNLNPMVF